MAHPIHHAESSARKFGGKAGDYLAIHDWFDASKAHEALPSHRALRHHSFGIFEAQSVFGHEIVNADGRRVPVRFIGEQHVREDCRRIPSVSDWLRGVSLAPWMVNGVILPDIEKIGPDPRSDWQAAVASGQTDLGFREWLMERTSRLQNSMNRKTAANIPGP